MFSKMDCESTNYGVRLELTWKEENVRTIEQYTYSVTSLLSANIVKWIEDLIEGVSRRSRNKGVQRIIVMSEKVLLSLFQIAQPPQQERWCGEIVWERVARAGPQLQLQLAIFTSSRRKRDFQGYKSLMIVLKRKIKIFGQKRKKLL
jgi:hypothetical protein